MFYRAVGRLNLKFFYSLFNSQKNAFDGTDVVGSISCLPPRRLTKIALTLLLDVVAYKINYSSGNWNVLLALLE